MAALRPRRASVRANRLLRLATLLLIVAGLVVHLAIGTTVGLGLAAAGLLAHVAAAIVGRWWWRKRTQAGSRPNKLARR
jgi:hypothetical protein